MNKAPFAETPAEIKRLKCHIDAKTFGRLHDLNVARSKDGRLRVSAVAHSRFVGQLAEWAVLERVAATDVDLSIRVCTSTRFTRVQK